MKIALFSLLNLGGRGGTESVLISVAEDLKTRGAEVKLFMLRPPIHKDFLSHFEQFALPEEVPAFIRKRSFWRPRILFRFFYQKSLRAFFQKIYEEKFDALIIVDGNGEVHSIYKHLKFFKEVSSEVPVISWLHGKPFLTFHEDQRIVKSMSRSISEFQEIFDYHLVISDGTYDVLKTIVSPDKMSLVYNPIKEAWLTPRSNLNQFVYLGRITEEKRVLELVSVLSRLSGEWSLKLIGAAVTDKDKEYENKIKSMINEKKIQEKISWLGWQEQPFSVFDKADLLLLHSKNEGFGLVLVEAMMRGIPCVAADCPVGPASILQNGINGWLYNMDDERELQKIIQEIIDKKRKLPDPELVQKSVEKFEKDVVCGKIFLSIKKVIQEKKDRI